MLPMMRFHPRAATGAWATVVKSKSGRRVDDRLVAELDELVSVFDVDRAAGSTRSMSPDAISNPLLWRSNAGARSRSASLGLPEMPADEIDLGRREIDLRLPAKTARSKLPRGADDLRLADLLDLDRERHCALAEAQAADGARRLRTSSSRRRRLEAHAVAQCRRRDRLQAPGPPRLPGAESPPDRLSPSAARACHPIVVDAEIDVDAAHGHPDLAVDDVVVRAAEPQIEAEASTTSPSTRSDSSRRAAHRRRTD